MKFLYVMEYYPPYVMGGAERSGQALVEQLVKKGHKVTVLTPNYGSYVETIEKEGNLSIIRFKTFRSFLWNKRTVTKGASRIKPFFYLIIHYYMRFSAWEFTKKIKKEIRREKNSSGEQYDVISANNMESTLALLNLKKNEENETIKRVVHLRDFGLFCFNRGLKDQKDFTKKHDLKECLPGKGFSFIARNVMQKQIRILNKKLSSVDVFLPISEFVKRRYLENLSISKEKMHVLYNTVSEKHISLLSKNEARKILLSEINKMKHSPSKEIKEIKKSTWKKIVVYAGTLSEEKGVLLIPEIAKLLPDYLFVIVGSGILENKLKGKNIEKLGQKDSATLRDIYKAADVVIVPSLWNEPFGRVVVEATLNECALVTSNKGALPEVVSWVKNGSVIEPTAKNFVKAIKTAKYTKPIKLPDHAKEYLIAISK